MPTDAESKTSSESHRTRPGLLVKCGIIIPTFFVRGRHGSPEDPNRLVMTTADSPKKRKRALSPLPTRKIVMHSEEPKTTDMSSEKTMTTEELDQQKTNARALFDIEVDNMNVTKTYDELRARFLQDEEEDAWDRPARPDESKPRSEDEKKDDTVEERAADIIRAIREYERNVTFGNLASEALPLDDDRDMGGQYLTNKDRIDHQSKLYQIAKIVPKGALLHLHFNAELHPELLLVRARKMDNMYIRSTIPITKEEHLGQTEMVFNVVDPGTVNRGVDIFSASYPRLTNPRDIKNPAYLKTVWMPWSKFQTEFKEKFPGLYKQEEPETFQAGRPPRYCGERSRTKLTPAENWLRSKMVLSQDEAYRPTQTVNGVWARFNQATRAFKGLLNYEGVYKEYIGRAIDRMIEEKVMYAELRPMLLDKSIPSDDGKLEIKNSAQMQLIVDAVKEKKASLEKEGKLDKFPFGLKIIYCTPRSIPDFMMKEEMKQCIELKLQFRDLICGFDLVGAEDRPNHIGFYKKELVAFKATCRELGLDIPFMFHAGETLLDTGGSDDPANSNLYDAAALKSKRIGHGFALMKHPHLVKEFKRNKSVPGSGICIELCPISNELLHLCRKVKEHPYPELLAAGIPCTVNSDNPSLFSNSMSHEFYQIMVGAPSMSLYSWKQLAIWSLEYSCLSTKEISHGKDILKKSWREFCKTVVEDYGPLMMHESSDKIDVYKAEVSYPYRSRIHADIEKAEADEKRGPDWVKAERERAKAWRRSLPSESVLLKHRGDGNHIQLHGTE